jgi:hypothetical protein
VAPLAVFFDASGTTAPDVTSRPFHDLGYGWNFGDAGPSAEAWPTGSRPGLASKNTATGPVAAHVYETPGTYDVTLAVTDGTNVATVTCAQITVQQPDTVFAGENTICFSQASDFSSAPCNAPGTVTSSTPSFATAIAMAAPGKRLLFRRGETWDVPAAGTGRLMVNGPGIIGAYGAGATPVIRAAGVTTMLAISDGASPNISDWRVMDLEFDGQGGTNVNAVVGAGASSQMTFLRLNIHNTKNGIQFSESILVLLGAPHALYDQLTIANSTIQNLDDGGGPLVFNGGVGMFLQANRLAVLGNSIVNTEEAEHVLRIQFTNKAAIQANDLRRPAATKHALTLRAVTIGTASTSSFTTQGVVISDNLLEGGLGNLPFQIQPSASSEDQRLANIVVDGNLVRSGSNAQAGVIVSADEITLRNNIFNLSGGTVYQCMIFERSGAEPSHSGMFIYNNTCFTGDTTVNPLRLVFLNGAAATLSNIMIKNNLGWAPNSTGVSAVLLNLGAGVSITGGSGTFGNSLDAQIQSTDPNFAGGMTPVTVSDFAVNAGSYAINAGVVVPVFADIRRILRPQGVAFDIGATEQ